jgi:hypothetical protein
MGGNRYISHVEESQITYEILHLQGKGTKLSSAM